MQAIYKVRYNTIILKITETSKRHLETIQNVTEIQCEYGGNISDQFYKLIKKRTVIWDIEIINEYFGNEFINEL